KSKNTSTAKIEKNEEAAATAAGGNINSSCKPWGCTLQWQWKLQWYYPLWGRKSGVQLHLPAKSIMKVACKGPTTLEIEVAMARVELDHT
ncbi:hypothetical protein Taro_011498, partial [Colocasia esculenta]|nr:hypothetical protein [Colocasia esculenta]